MKTLSNTLLVAALLLQGAAKLEAVSVTREEIQLFNLVNAERAKAGVPALQFEPRLQQAAINKLEDMLKRGYFSHEIPGKSRWSWFVDQSGFHYTALAENISAISCRGTAQQHHRLLMSSSGHRRNILNARYSLTGMALARHGDRSVAIQVFASP